MEETTYEKLPLLKITEIVKKPKPGEETGEPVELILEEVSTYAQKSKTLINKKTGEPAITFWHKVTYNGEKYSFPSSEAVTKKILATGVKKSELPIKILVRQWVKVIAGEMHKSYNIDIENHRNDFKATLEELINSYDGKSNNQIMVQQTQQVFQPQLTASRDFEKEKKETQQNIMIGMAINIGSDDFRTTKTKKSRVELIQEAFNDISEAKKLIVNKLNTPEEIIKGVDFPTDKGGVFPVDESDMDEIDEAFGSK